MADTAGGGSQVISSNPVEAPDVEQVVPKDVPGFSAIKEGLAYILVPEDAPTSLDPEARKNGLAQYQSVFYNPIQQFNRDLTVLAIRAYGEDLLAVRKMRPGPKPVQGKKRKRTTASTETNKPLGDTHANGYADQEAKVQTSAHIAHTSAAHDGDSNDIEVDETLAPRIEASEHKEESVPRFKILDALSATGLRALRYAKEIPFVTSITANDLSPQATASITANTQYNGVEDKIKVTTENAMSHMYNFIGQPGVPRSHKYDVIDLDPYGTAAPFFDATMQAISDGGLICITCTDAGVWASCGYPEKTYALYGGTPIKGLHSHEGGLRLILHSIASTAARYGMAIEPLMSLSIDFYARVFVRVFKSQAEVKFLVGKTMLVYSCDAGCGSWRTQLLAQEKSFKSKDGTTIYKHSLAQGPNAVPFCEHCGMKTHMSGPMYAGPLHNPDFLGTILSYLPDLDKTTYATVDRIEGMVSTALEEILLNENPDTKNPVHEDNPKPARPVPRMNPAKVENHPFFFIPSALSKVIHCQSPPEAEFKGALRHAGYNVTRSHARPGSIRTNAPWSFIWKVMLEWTRQKAPIRENAIKPGTAGWGIMQKYTPKPNASHSDASDPEGKSAVEPDKLRDIVKQDSTKEQSIKFDAQLGRRAEKKGLLRYQINPRENWGPMNRAKAKPREKET